MVTTCLSCLTAGGPDTEHGACTVLPPKTNRENLRGAERREEMPAHNISYQPPRILLAGIHLGWEMRMPPGRMLSQTRYGQQARWLARDNPETNSITIKPETVSHAPDQFSWVPSPHWSPPRRPFLVKSFALSVRVSPQTIHFWVLDKSPLLGPGRGTPSCNKSNAHCLIPLPTTNCYEAHRQGIQAKSRWLMVEMESPFTQPLISFLFTCRKNACPGPLKSLVPSFSTLAFIVYHLGWDAE